MVAIIKIICFSFLQLFLSFFLLQYMPFIAVDKSKTLRCVFHSMAVHSHICVCVITDHYEVRCGPRFQRLLFISDIYVQKICSNRNTHFIAMVLANFRAESKVNLTGNDFDTRCVNMCCDFVSLTQYLFISLFIRLLVCLFLFSSVEFLFNEFVFKIVLRLICDC